mmetsp:Transcript_94884/g.245670  ORF Transcript_94884/g.245670 Transcript_94884/m.245670 type:complete len:141 (+) Transcript_94884:757-1179(+)
MVVDLAVAAAVVGVTCAAVDAAVDAAAGDVVDAAAAAAIVPGAGVEVALAEPTALTAQGHTQDVCRRHQMQARVVGLLACPPKGLPRDQSLERLHSEWPKAANPDCLAKPVALHCHQPRVVHAELPFAGILRHATLQPKL